jgi:small subunit ribosomal protein S11
MAKQTNKKITTKAKKKSGAPVTDHGRVYITATFNNTLVTVTNEKGDTLGWSSSGTKGFKGTRKSTPYAASVSVE